MTEKFQDQISAFVDDELSAEECAFFVRRLERDPAARDQLVRYAKIGAALRGELLYPDPDILRRKLQQALSGVSVPPERRAARPGRHSKLLKPAVGFGIAATVAVAAVFALRFVSEGELGAGAAPGQQSLQAAQQTEAPSYVVPQDVEAERLVSPPIRLTNYLMRHSEYANRVRRTSFHSDVVGTTDAEAAAELEDAPE